jgi:phage-related protein
VSNEITLKFGGLALDGTNDVVIGAIEVKESKAVKTVSIPKTDGSIAETARRSAITISMSGDVAGSTYDGLRANIDGFKAILQNGLQKFIMDDDRYVYAQLKDFSYSYKTMMSLARWSASFVAHYPFWTAEVASSYVATPVSAATFEVSNPGNSPARVKITLTNGANSIVDDIQIDNVTNGQAFQYRGTLLGTKVLEIDNRYDTDDLQVLNNGADDIVNFEGDFLELAAGTNYLSFTGASAVTMPELALYFRGTWF